MHGKRNGMPAAKLRLLLVDDDPLLRHLLGTILTNSGYLVRLANDGRAALAEMNIEIPDILVSDLYMPGMSGFELLNLVESNFPQVHVIAMSSAYTGIEVPHGVAAHAFYEKATDVRNLLGLIDGTSLAAKVA